MNIDIRKMLIERAKDNSPIPYGKIMDQFSLDQYSLSIELEKIARFEHENKRPMLTVMARYKDGGYGGEFFRLAEEFGHGAADKLQKGSFTKDMREKCHQYWLGVAQPLVKPNSRPPFFSQAEINFFNSWITKVYDKDDPVHVAAKDQIMNTIGAKTKYWARELVNRVAGYESYDPRVWHTQGWDASSGVNERVVKFKHYSWARIYKTGDKNRDIFFTVEVNGEQKCLVYKLDYFFEAKSKLNEQQKALCKQLIPDEVAWLTIDYNDIPKYDWDSLLAKTELFIRDYSTLYDEIVESVWTGQVNVSALKERLILRELPDDGYPGVPDRNFDFTGRDTDWEQLQRDLKSIGTIGEDLVIEYEKQRLEDDKRSDLASAVVRVRDGEGYDIKSWDKHGNPKFIEVKSTTGQRDAVFPISLYEMTFSEQNKSNYYLYRIYNINIDKKVGELHIYKGSLKEQFFFEGIAFNAYRKSKNLRNQ